MDLEAVNLTVLPFWGLLAVMGRYLGLSPVRHFGRQLKNPEDVFFLERKLWATRYQFLSTVCLGSNSTFYRKTTNIICWGPSASEGPQKHVLIMFSKWNMWTGIFGNGLWVYNNMVRTKLEWDERRLWRRIRWPRSYAQKSFGMTAEKGNRLKDEKPN
jgi:hypothetical protein